MHVRRFTTSKLGTAVTVLVLLEDRCSATLVPLRVRDAPDYNPDVQFGKRSSCTPPGLRGLVRATKARF